MKQLLPSKSQASNFGGVYSDREVQKIMMKKETAVSLLYGRQTAEDSAC